MPPSLPSGAEAAKLQAAMEDLQQQELHTVCAEMFGQDRYILMC